MSFCRPIFPVLALVMLNGCSLLGSDSNDELGKPCDLGFDAGMSQAAYNPQAPGCPSLCLKPSNQSKSDSETAPYCTTTCSSDSDCDGQEREGDDPLDRRCIRGYACGIAFAVGPLCCQKLCLCKDFLDQRGVVVPPNCQTGADGQSGCGIN